MMKKIECLLGDKFNKLTVIEIIPNKKGTLRKCICDCGNECVKMAAHINSSHVKSCGCLWQEAINKSTTTHGMCHSRIYNIWRCMILRCNYKSHDSYKYYGGRGIKIERNSFEEFDRDMGPTYKDGLTIERNDNNKNYCKENCSWKTMKAQGQNRRNTVLIEYNGKKQTIGEWSKEINIRETTLRSRRLAGWTDEKIITFTS